ncbi:ATP-binding protein [Streptomyces griseus]|uniref:ATP-binding protein n=1 Tax=Streptomyces griseus TaxID=1911 RepID=UPI00068CFD29|nr:AAA family ATPase [Streptomyces griseus]
MTTAERHGNGTAPPNTLFQEQLHAQDPGFAVTGIPAEASAVDAAMLRTRLISAADHFRGRHGRGGFSLTVTDLPAPHPAHRGGGDGSPLDPDVLSVEERASYFTAVPPRYSFDFLVLPDEVMDDLLLAVESVTLRPLLFDTWNLRSIEPNPSAAINLHGDPGTGKTLAAHAIADRLGKPILHTKYSQLESKYHGEGPKNLDALFHAARAQDAVLFVDEADALMSQRFESTSQGSEHAVNAMRSELVMSLDGFDGIVVFATNLVTGYDRAFDSRVRHIRFPAPDRAARRMIWRNHLPAELPLGLDVDVEELADLDELSGREIRRAVIDAATDAARTGHGQVTRAHLLAAVDRIKASRIRRATDPAPPQPVTADDALAEKATQALAEAGPVPDDDTDGGETRR